MLKQKQTDNQHLRTLLTKQLIIISIVLSLILIFISSLLLSINYQSLRMSKRIYPLMQALYSLNDTLSENSITLRAWTQTNSPALKERVTVLLGKTIPMDLVNIQQLIQGRKDAERFGNIMEEFKHISWLTWKVFDIADTEGNRPAFNLYRKKLVPTYNLAKKNLRRQPPGSQETKSINVINWYSQLSDIQNMLGLYLQTGKDSYVDQIKRTISTLQNEIGEMHPISEWQSSTISLTNQYLSQAQKVIQLRKRPNWNAALYELTNEYAPARLALSKHIDTLITEQENIINTLNSRVYIIGVLSFAAIILTLIGYIMIGYRVISRLQLNVVKPIERLTLEMRQIAEGTPDIIIEPGKIYELNELIKSFLYMIKQRALYEKQLLADKKSLHYLAYHDLLTGMNNYQFLLKHLKEQMQAIVRNHTGQQVALCYIFIRNLDEINNIWGQQLSDELVRKFSKGVGQSLSQNMFSARVSSNSYVIYWLNESLDEVKIYLNKLEQLLTRAVHVDQAQVNFSFAIGVAIYPEHAKDVGQLIEHARFAALQIDKKSKHKFRIFSIEDKALLVRKSTLQKDIEVAINNNEIFLLYQPQYELKTNRLLGCEVLVRWEHPEYGLLSPTEFVPLAEHGENILQLGHYIQQTALAQYAQWHKLYPQPFKLAINASLVELTSENFAEQLFSLIDTYKLPANLIEIEVTETVASKYPELFIAAIEKLKQRGVSVAIDDFGTGYSSLERLKTLKVDLLKIDRLFITDVAEDEASKKLFMSIIKLAQVVNLPTLVEGIETAAQAEIALAAGCQYGQGFYLGHPLTVEQMSSLLDDVYRK